MKKDSNNKIGLALGGGGPRGLAHIGVIKKLEEIGVEVDLIAGTSIGADIGGTYAASADINKIESLALETDRKSLFDLFAQPSFLGGGLIGTDGIEEYLEEHFGRKKFKDLKIPFEAVATDINSGEQVNLNQGDLIKAIIASLSIPLVFKPTKLDGKMLVDGGLSAPVPVGVAQKMGADKVIAVNLLHFPKQKKNRPQEPDDKLGMMKVANNTIDILRHHLADYSAKKADVVIKPDVAKTSWAKFADANQVIKKGEKATMSKKDRLQGLIR